MTIAPIIDASWHRLPEDAFGAGPSLLTPLDPSSSTRLETDSDGSEWSFTDEEELVTLDLGTERIAKRVLLGYSVGADLDADSSVPVARSVRGFRGSTGGGEGETDKRTKTGAADAASSTGGSSGPHLGAGKPLSITGLDTSTPLMKIGDTVLRGSNMELFGTEIVLVDEFDPTRAKAKQHRLRPLPPSIRDGRPDAASTTTRKRIQFRPIYDPKARQAIGNNADAYAKLRAIAKLPAQQNMQIETRAQEEQASLANLTSTSTEAWQERETEQAPSQRSVGKGKYKRKDVSEEEQMIRAAERKIRKAAKLHLRQQQEQQQELHPQQADQRTHGPAQDSINEQAQDHQGKVSGQNDSTTSQQPRPPPSPQ